MRFAPSAKFAAVIVAAGLALTACGGSSGGSSNSSGDAVDGTGKKLSVLTGVNNQYPEQQKEWFKDIAAKFKAETGAEVEFETFASANDELTRIQTSVVSGQGPDVYSLGTTFTPTAYATKAFVTLSDDDWNKVGGKDRFNQAALGISGPDKDHLAGIPFVSRPFVMAYNKDLLAAAGIEKPATTWDELAEQAKKMTNAGAGTYGLATGYKDNFDPWKFIWAMSVQAGNPLVDGDKLKMDDPSVKKAYETYFGWLTKDKIVDPAAIGWSNSNAVAAFASGKAGYLMMTTSSPCPRSTSPRSPESTPTPPCPPWLQVKRPRRVTVTRPPASSPATTWWLPTIRSRRTSPLLTSSSSRPRKNSQLPEDLR